MLNELDDNAYVKNITNGFLLLRWGDKFEGTMQQTINLMMHFASMLTKP